VQHRLLAGEGAVPQPAGRGPVARQLEHLPEPTEDAHPVEPREALHRRVPLDDAHLVVEGADRLRRRLHHRAGEGAAARDRVAGAAVRTGERTYAARGALDQEVTGDIARGEG
jgi:hypothetical protein